MVAGTTGTSNRYKVIVAAQIDPAQIQAQLLALQNNVTLHLNVQINQAGAQQAAQQTVTNVQNIVTNAQNTIRQNTANAPGLLINLPKEVNNAQQAIDHIKNILSNMKNVELISIRDTSNLGLNSGMISAVTKYTDEAGQAREETHRWRVELDQITGAANITQLDTITKSTMNYKKVQDELADAMEKVNDARASTAGRTQSVAEVQKVLDLSNQLEAATAKARLPGATHADIELVRDLGGRLDVAKKEMGNLGKNTLSFNQAMKTAFERITQWGIATGIIYGGIRQFKEMVEYVKELNKEMTNIQLVTGQSEESVRALASSYNDLATELGATTLEVAQGSLEWIRQGKTAEETRKLLEASVMMGKLANIDQTKSTEYLISIMNGYKLSLEDLMPTIDRLVALDNSFAVSVEDIAQAMQRSANSAAMVQVPLEELAAMITVVKDVTQKSSESIGESLTVCINTYSYN